MPSNVRNEVAENDERHSLLKDEDDASIELNGGKISHQLNGGKNSQDAVEEGLSPTERIRLNEVLESGSVPKSGSRWNIRAFIARPLETLTSHFRALPSAVSQLGFRGTVRTIFNYPERSLKLRSTAWLDGLRGLAAFEVFVFHYIDGWVDRTKSWGNGDHMRPEWYYAPVIRTFYASGDAAVCLFFGISGYVLSYRMLDLMRQRRNEELLKSLSSAVFRRGIRLYGPVVVETFTLMILCRWFNLPKPAQYEAAPTFLLELKSWYISFVHLLLPLRYPDRWDALQDRYDGGISWTIPLEYYGSLYIYMAVIFLSQVPSVVARRCLAFGMVVQSITKDDWIAAQFVMGMAFADYQLERQYSQRQKLSHNPQSRLSKLRPAFFAGLAFFGFYFSGLPGALFVEGSETVVQSRPWYDWFVQPIAWTGIYYQRQADRYVLCFVTMCSLAGIGETPILRKLLERRFVQYLGRISFGLYLCHIFLRPWLDWLRIACLSISGLDPDATYWARPDSDNGKLILAYVMFMIPAMAVNFIFGGLFERYLDRPSVAAGKWFENWCKSWKGSSHETPPLQMHEIRNEA